MATSTDVRLQPGDKAPDFTLTDDHGATVRSVTCAGAGWSCTCTRPR